MLFFLFSAERNSQYFDLSLSQNYNIIKQRSTAWLTLRKTAKVTGSTLYNALGLSSLSDLKQHHYQFIKKRSPPPFSDDVKKRLEYETQNEKHIIGTVLGNSLPALLPHCFAFQEVGSVFLDIAGEENFIEVSTDGLLMCFGGDACPEKKTTQNHFAILLEGKCLFPDSSKPIEPMYQIYPHYVPQTLAEMVAYNAKLLWLLSFAVSSVVLLNIRFDKKLWEMMCRICTDLHGGQKPKVPVKLHPETKALKSHITKFISTHCSFVCEIPSYFGLETALRESSIISPYSFCSLREKQIINKETIKKECKIICVESKPLFNDIHNTLRQEVQEVLVFMLSDHNCHHKQFIPYSLPLGYTMKGKNMSNNDLRYLVNRCRNTLKQRNVPVLCEVYDGQWQNMCMTSEKGLPLTELRLIKPTWQRVQKMTKEKCLQEMVLAAKISRRHLELMAKIPKLNRGKVTYHNLTLTGNADSTVDVVSTGGLTFKEPAIKYIRTITQNSRPDLWLENAEENVIDEGNEVNNTKKKKGNVCRLTESEKSIVHLLDSEIVRDLQEALGENFMLEEPVDNITTDGDVDYEKELLWLALNHSDISLLTNIIDDLRELNPEKWRNLTQRRTLPQYTYTANKHYQNLLCSRDNVYWENA